MYKDKFPFLDSYKRIITLNIMHQLYKTSFELFGFDTINVVR